MNDNAKAMKALKKAAENARTALDRIYWTMQTAFDKVDEMDYCEEEVDDLKESLEKIQEAIDNLSGDIYDLI